jgi:hypothetical protein
MHATAFVIWSTFPLVLAQNYPRVAPYPAIRWQNTTPEVRVNDSWYVLLALNDIEVTRIVAFAKQKYERIWQKRFDEDLVQVLTELGHPTGKAVKLSLSDPKTKKQHTIPAALLTEANRGAIMEFKYGGGRPDSPLSAGDPRQALDEFDKAVKSQWSYYPLSKVEIDKAIACLRTKLDKAAVDGFGLELQKIIALGIDGHAAVGGFRLPEGFLPFLCESAGERLVAFQPDRKGLKEAEIFHYDKPVVVLMNSKCFSATDIFVAGLKGLPNVTLMGTPSGGGSALVQTVRLDGPRLAVRLGSMVSFQANGKLFDGHGVQPDLLVEPTPEYFIGGPDNVLEAAISRLTAEKR